MPDTAVPPTARDTVATVHIRNPQLSYRMSPDPRFSVQTKRRYRLSHGPIAFLSDETSQSREVHRVPRGSHLVHHAGGGSARETRARVSSA